MLPLPRGAVWQIFFLLCAVLLANEVRSEGRVVCYYTNWSVYRPGTAKFNPQNINPYLCTHLVYAFGGFTKDNTMKPFDKYQDIEQGGYAKFTGLKTYNKQLKTMIAIGGWNEASSRFSPLVASSERRQQFIKNILKFLRQNHFDGIDLDWEYPAHRDGGKDRDKDNYAQFVQELRAEFDRESAKTGRPRLLLTMAVPAGIQYIEKGYDIPKLNKYLDWFNMLTYDFHSSHEPSANHHAPLYSMEEDDEYNFDSELNIDYSVKFYLDAGADRDKLVLGIPTYGRSYTLFNEESTDLGAPADGPGEQGDATREKGYLAYYEICQNIKEDPDWKVVQPNPKAMGPYAFKGNQWVGYDDEAIVRKKAEYVVDHGLGGIMFWAIDNDDFRGTCTGKPYPLIEAAKETYLDRLGVGGNEISKPTSQKKPSSRNRNRGGSSNRNKVDDVPEKAVSVSRKRPATRKRPQTERATTTTTTTGSSLYVGGRTTTPEPPTTPDPGSDFKCEDEGFFQHPRDCKKYFWCLDSGPSNLGIVAHQFTCPSGLYFNPAADSCDFARNVPCKKNPKEPASTTTSKPKTTTTTTTARTTTSSYRVTAATSRNSFARFTSTTTQAPEEDEEEYEDEVEDAAVDAEEDPRVIKELIDLIKKVGGIEELEKHLLRQEDGSVMLKKDEIVSSGATTTPASISKSLFEKVLNRPNNLNAFRNKFTSSSLFRTSSKTTTATKEDGGSVKEDTSAGSRYSSVVRNSRPGPQNAGIEKLQEFDGFLKEKKQYVTIQRTRPLLVASAEQSDDDDDTKDVQKDAEDEDDEEDVVVVTSSSRRPTTATPSYTSIRRTRPSTVRPEEEDEDTEDVIPEKKTYSPLNRNRVRSTTDVTPADIETTTVGGTRYKFLERTRPTRRPTVAVTQQADVDEEADGSEGTLSITVQYSEPNEISTQSPTQQQPQTTTRAYASIGRRTTTTTSTTTTDQDPITATPESFVIDTTTPEPIVITTTTTTTTTNPISIETSTQSSTTTPILALSSSSTLDPTSTSQDVEISTDLPQLPNSLATESGLDTQELDSTQNQILTETTTPDDIDRNEVTNPSTTTTSSPRIKSQSSLSSSSSSNSIRGNSYNKLSGGGRRQKTTKIPNTLDTNQQEPETATRTNDFLGTVSSPRPFGFPRRRTRPSTTTTSSDNAAGDDELSSSSTANPSESATPLVKKVSSTQESYLRSRSRLAQNLDRAQNVNADTSVVVDHVANVVGSLVEGNRVGQASDEGFVKKRTYSWKDARNTSYRPRRISAKEEQAISQYYDWQIGQGARRDDDSLTQAKSWQTIWGQTYNPTLSYRDGSRYGGDGNGFGLNGFDRFAGQWDSGSYKADDSGSYRADVRGKWRGKSLGQNEDSQGVFRRGYGMQGQDVLSAFEVDDDSLTREQYANRGSRVHGDRQIEESSGGGAETNVERRGDGKNRVRVQQTEADQTKNGAENSQYRGGNQLRSYVAGQTAGDTVESIRTRNLRRFGGSSQTALNSGNYEDSSRLNLQNTLSSTKNNAQEAIQREEEATKENSNIERSEEELNSSVAKSQQESEEKTLSESEDSKKDSQVSSLESNLEATTGTTLLTSENSVLNAEQQLSTTHSKEEKTGSQEITSGTVLETTDKALDHEENPAQQSVNSLGSIRTRNQNRLRLLAENEAKDKESSSNRGSTRHRISQGSTNTDRSIQSSTENSKKYFVRSRNQNRVEETTEEEATKEEKNVKKYIGVKEEISQSQEEQLNEERKLLQLSNEEQIRLENEAKIQEINTQLYKTIDQGSQQSIRRRNQNALKRTIDEDLVRIEGKAQVEDESVYRNKNLSIPRGFSKSETMGEISSESQLGATADRGDTVYQTIQIENISSAPDVTADSITIDRGSGFYKQNVEESGFKVKNTATSDRGDILYKAVQAVIAEDQINGSVSVDRSNLQYRGYNLTSGGGYNSSLNDSVGSLNGTETASNMSTETSEFNEGIKAGSSIGLQFNNVNNQAYKSRSSYRGFNEATASQGVDSVHRQSSSALNKAVSGGQGRSQVRSKNNATVDETGDAEDKATARTIKFGSEINRSANGSYKFGIGTDAIVSKPEESNTETVQIADSVLEDKSTPRAIRFGSEIYRSASSSYKFGIGTDEESTTETVQIADSELEAVIDEDEDLASSTEAGTTGGEYTQTVSGGRTASRFGPARGGTIDEIKIGISQNVDQAENITSSGLSLETDIKKESSNESHIESLNDSRTNTSHVVIGSPEYVRGTRYQIGTQLLNETSGTEKVAGLYEIAKGTQKQVITRTNETSGSEAQFASDPSREVLGSSARTRVRFGSAYGESYAKTKFGTATESATEAVIITEVTLKGASEDRIEAVSKVEHDDSHNVAGSQEYASGTRSQVRSRTNVSKNLNSSGSFEIATGNRGQVKASTDESDRQRAGSSGTEAITNSRTKIKFGSAYGEPQAKIDISANRELAGSSEFGTATESATEAVIITESTLKAVSVDQSEDQPTRLHTGGRIEAGSEINIDHSHNVTGSQEYETGTRNQVRSRTRTSSTNVTDKNLNSGGLFEIAAGTRGQVKERTDEGEQVRQEAGTSGAEAITNSRTRIRFGTASGRAIGNTYTTANRNLVGTYKLGSGTGKLSKVADSNSETEITDSSLEADIEGDLEPITTTTTSRAPSAFTSRTRLSGSARRTYTRPVTPATTRPRQRVFTLHTTEGTNSEAHSDTKKTLASTQGVEENESYEEVYYEQPSTTTRRPGPVYRGSFRPKFNDLSSLLAIDFHRKQKQPAATTEGNRVVVRRRRPVQRLTTEAPLEEEEVERSTRPTRPPRPTTTTEVPRSTTRPTSSSSRVVSGFTRRPLRNNTADSATQQGSYAVRRKVIRKRIQGGTSLAKGTLYKNENVAEGQSIGTEQLAVKDAILNLLDEESKANSTDSGAMLSESEVKVAFGDSSDNQDKTGVIVGLKSSNGENEGSLTESSDSKRKQIFRNRFTSSSVKASNQGLVKSSAEDSAGTSDSVKDIEGATVPSNNLADARRKQVYQNRLTSTSFRNRNKATEVQDEDTTELPAAETTTIPRGNSRLNHGDLSSLLSHDTDSKRRANATLLLKKQGQVRPSIQKITKETVTQGDTITTTTITETTNQLTSSGSKFGSGRTFSQRKTIVQPQEVTLETESSTDAMVDVSTANEDAAVTEATLSQLGTGRIISSQGPGYFRTSLEDSAGVTEQIPKITEEIIVTMESGLPLPSRGQSRTTYQSSYEEATNLVDGKVGSQGLETDENPTVPIYTRRKYYKYLTDSPIIYIGKIAAADQATSSAEKADINKTILEVFDVFNHSRAAASAKNQENAVGDGEASVNPQDTPPKSNEDGTAIAHEINRQLDNFLVSAPRTSKNLGATESSSFEDVSQTTEVEMKDEALKLAIAVNSMGVGGVEIPLEGSGELSAEVADLELKLKKESSSQRSGGKVNAIEINAIAYGSEDLTSPATATEKKTLVREKSEYDAITRRAFSSRPSRIRTTTESVEDESSTTERPLRSSYKGRIFSAEQSVIDGQDKDQSKILDSSTTANTNSETSSFGVVSEEGLRTQKTEESYENLVTVKSTDYEATVVPSLDDFESLTTISPTIEHEHDVEALTVVPIEVELEAELDSPVNELPVIQLSETTTESHRSAKTFREYPSSATDQKDDEIASQSVTEIAADPELPSVESTVNEQGANQAITESSIKVASQSFIRSRITTEAPEVTTEDLEQSTADPASTRRTFNIQSRQRPTLTSEPVEEEDSNASSTDSSLLKVSQARGSNRFRTTTVTALDEDDELTADIDEDNEVLEETPIRLRTTTARSFSSTRRTFSGLNRAQTTETHNEEIATEIEESSTEKSAAATRRTFASRTRSRTSSKDAIEREATTEETVQSTTRRTFNRLRTSSAQKSTTENNIGNEEENETDRPSTERGRSFGSRNRVKVFGSKTSELLEGADSKTDIETETDTDGLNEIVSTVRPFSNALNRLRTSSRFNPFRTTTLQSIETTDGSEDESTSSSTDATTRRSFNSLNRLRTRTTAVPQTSDANEENDALQTNETTDGNEDQSTSSSTEAPTRRSFNGLNRLRIRTTSVPQTSGANEENDTLPAIKNTDEKEDESTSSSTEATTRRSFNSLNRLRIRTTSVPKTSEADEEIDIDVTEENEHSSTRRTISSLNRLRFATTAKTPTTVEESEDQDLQSSTEEIATRRTFNGFNRPRTTTPGTTENSEVLEEESVTEVKDSDISTTRRSLVGRGRQRLTTTSPSPATEASEASEEESVTTLENLDLTDVGSTRRPFAGLNRLRTTATDASVDESSTDLEDIESSTISSTSFTRRTFAGLNRVRITISTESSETSEAPEEESVTDLESITESATKRTFAGLNRLRTTTTDAPVDKSSTDIENIESSTISSISPTRRTFTGLSRVRTTTSPSTESSEAPEEDPDSETTDSESLGLSTVDAVLPTKRTFTSFNRLRTTTIATTVASDDSEPPEEESTTDLESLSVKSSGTTGSTRRTFTGFNRLRTTTTASAKVPETETQVELEDSETPTATTRRTFTGPNRLRTTTVASSTTPETEEEDTDSTSSTRRTFAARNRFRTTTIQSDKSEGADNAEKESNTELEVEDSSSSDGLATSRRTFTGFNRLRTTTTRPSLAKEDTDAQQDADDTPLDENVSTTRRTFGGFNRSRTTKPPATEASNVSNQETDTEVELLDSGNNDNSVTTRRTLIGINRLRIKTSSTKVDSEVTDEETSTDLEEKDSKTETSSTTRRTFGALNRQRISTTLPTKTSATPTEREENEETLASSITRRTLIGFNRFRTSTTAAPREEKEEEEDDQTAEIDDEANEENLVSSTTRRSLVGFNRFRTSTTVAPQVEEEEDDQSAEIDDEDNEANLVSSTTRRSLVGFNRFRTSTTVAPQEEEDDQTAEIDDEENEEISVTGVSSRRPPVGINVVRTTTIATTRKPFVPINRLRTTTKTSPDENENEDEDHEEEEEEIPPRSDVVVNRFTNAQQQRESGRTITQSRFQFASRQKNQDLSFKTENEADTEAGEDEPSDDEQFPSTTLRNFPSLLNRNQLKIKESTSSSNQTETNEEINEDENEQTPRNVVALLNRNRFRPSQAPQINELDNEDDNEEKVKLSVSQSESGTISTRLQKLLANRRPSNPRLVLTNPSNEITNNSYVDSIVESTLTNNSLSLTEVNLNSDERTDLGQDQDSDTEDSIVETNSNLSTNTPNLNRRFQRVQFNRTAGRRRPTITRTRTTTDATTTLSQVNATTGEDVVDLTSTSSLAVTPGEAGTSENAELAAALVTSTETAQKERRRFRVLKFRRPLIVNNSLSVEVNNSTNTTTSSTDSVDNLGVELDTTINTSTTSPTTPTRRFRKVIKRLRPVANRTITVNETTTELNSTARPLNVAELLSTLAPASSVPTTVDVQSVTEDDENVTVTEDLELIVTTFESATNETDTSEKSESESSTPGTPSTPNPRRLLVSRRPYRPTKPSINAITSTESSISSTAKTYVRKFNRNFKAIRPPSDAANGIGFIEQTSSRTQNLFQGRNRFNFATRTTPRPKEENEEDVEDEDYDEEKEDVEEDQRPIIRPNPLFNRNQAAQNQGNTDGEDDQEPEENDEEESEDVDEDEDDEDDEEEEEEEEVKSSPSPQSSYRPSNRPSFNRPANTPFGARRPAAPSPGNRYAVDRRTSTKPRVINRPALITLPPSLLNSEVPSIPTSITPPSVFISTNTRSYERKYSASSTEGTPQDQSNPLLEDLNIDALNARNKKIFEVNSKKHTTTIKPKTLSNQAQPSSETTDTPNNSLDTSTVFDDDEDNNLINSQDDSQVTTTAAGVTEQPAIEGQLISYSPKQKVVTINRVVEINSKEDKLRRKSKDEELKSVSTTELRAEGLPKLEPLGEISRVKYVHLVDRSGILVDGHSSVTDYTATEGSVFVRNTIPEVEPDSLENTRIEYQPGPTSSPIRNTIPGTDYSALAERKSKAITVPEVINDVVEASTISLQGLFDSARQAKKISQSANEVNGIFYAYSLGEVPTTPRNEKPTIATTTPLTTLLTTTPATTTTTTTTPIPSTTTTTTTTTPIPTTIETAAETTIETKTVSAPLVSTINRTYTRPIVPLLRPESNESPLVISIANLDKVRTATVPVRRPVVRRRPITTRQPAAKTSYDELNAPSTTTSSISADDDGAAGSTTSSTTSLFKYNRRTRPNYLTTIAAKPKPTPKSVSSSVAPSNPGEITSNTGSASTSSNDITFVTVNKLSNQKFASGAVRRKFIRPSSSSSSSLSNGNRSTTTEANSGSAVPPDGADPPRTQNPLFKRRFSIQTTSAPVTTISAAPTEFNTTPLDLDTVIPEDLDQIAKSSIQETKFLHNRLNENLNDRDLSPVVSVSSNIHSTTPLYPSTYEEPITRRLGYAATTRRPSLRRPQKTTPIPEKAPIFISRRRPHKTPAPFNKIIETPTPERTYKPVIDYDYYDDGDERVVDKPTASQVKVVLHGKGIIECLDQGNFPHPLSCRKFISCAKFETGGVVGWEYTCPKGLSYDPVGGMCNWSAGLGCKE